jgi:hypothetical protein
LYWELVFSSHAGCRVKDWGLIDSGEAELPAVQFPEKCWAILNRNQSQPMVAAMSATENIVFFRRVSIRNDIAAPQSRNAIRGLT